MYTHADKHINIFFIKRQSTMYRAGLDFTKFTIVFKSVKVRIILLGLSNSTYAIDDNVNFLARPQPDPDKHFYI